MKRFYVFSFKKIVQGLYHSKRESLMAFSFKKLVQGLDHSKQDGSLGSFELFPILITNQIGFKEEQTNKLTYVKSSKIK